MNAKNKHYIQLLNFKKELINQLELNDKYGVNNTLNDSIGELSSYDNHPADIGSEVFEKGKDLALREDSLQKLELINKAIDKLENGSYGTCERCDKVIPEERLDIVPETAYCYNCHKNFDDHDRMSSRPIEEEFLYPGFGKHDYDNSVHETELNSEDSWEAVAQYGTSSDLSMIGGETNYNEIYNEINNQEQHYHIEYDNVQIGEQEYDLDELYSNQIDEELTSLDTIEQQAYQDYLRMQNE
jgi:YteA family regulatory protein